MSTVQYGNSVSSDDDILSPREDLLEDLKSQIRFRQRTAERYPDDFRNAKAIEIFTKVAESVADVAEVLVLQYDQLLDDMPDDEYHDRFMRFVAFRYVPNPVTAEQFILDFIKGYKSGDWKK